MNSYDLSRAWFNWTFDNPEKVRPIHSAIYFFAIEHNNRLGWKTKFGFPTSMAMEAIGIKKWHTYSKALNDLVKWGFIKMVEKSKNQYSSNVISLKTATPKKGEALDKALAKHGSKQGHSTVDIDKQYNKEQSLYSESEFLEDWAKCRMTFNNLPTNIKKLETMEATNFERARQDFSRKEIQEAMMGLFRQEKINFSAMILRPAHFLERVEMYLNAYQSKDFKLYGAKPVEH